MGGKGACCPGFSCRRSSFFSDLTITTKNVDDEGSAHDDDDGNAKDHDDGDINDHDDGDTNDHDDIMQMIMMMVL